MKRFMKLKFFKKHLWKNSYLMRMNWRRQISITAMEEMKQIFPKETQEIREEGKLEGKLEEKIEIAITMKNEEIGMETISKITGLNLDEIEKL